MKLPVKIASILCVALLGAGCRDTPQQSASTSPAKPVTHGGTTDQATKTSVETGTSAGGGSVIKIDFSGAISHIIGQSPQRAVAISDAHHATKLEILKPTQIGKDATESEALLQKAVGDPTKNKATCAGVCVVEPLDGLLIRVVDSAGGTIQPALNAGADFDLLVPHLEKATKMTTPDKNLKGDMPTGDFTAFFELTGGTFSARPYCTPVALNPDNEGKGPRDFAQTVTLTGSTAKPAVLEFSNDGKNWRPLAFKRATLVVLRLSNDPDISHSDMAHFDLHEKIAEGTVPNYPKVAHAYDDCKAGSAVACGNSQYP